MQDQAGENKLSLTLILYAFLTGGLLISYLAVPVYDYEELSFPAFFGVVSIIAALMGFLLGKLWKDKGFILLFCFLLVIIIRIVIKDGSLLFTDQVSESIITGFWVIAGCYSLGRVFTKRQLKYFLHVIVSIWTTGITVSCMIALYEAWTDGIVWNLNGSGWDIIWFGRLRAGYFYPGITGGVLSISGVIALCAMLAEKNKLIKGLFLLSSLIIIIAMSLTDTRTAIVSLCAGIGALAFLYVFYMLRKKQEEIKQPEKRQIRRWIIPAICMIFAFLISIFLVLKVGPLFNSLKIRGNVVVSSAKAEEAEPEKLQIYSRGFSGEDVLNGRIELWKTVIRYLSENPKRLLFGESIYNPMKGPNQRLTTETAHCHNIPLQIILESGLTGLLLIGLFGIYTAKCTSRIIVSKNAPLWLCLVPAVIVTELVGDLGECFGWLRQWKLPCLAFLFVSIGIVNAYGGRKTIDAEGTKG